MEPKNSNIELTKKFKLFVEDTDNFSFPAWNEIPEIGLYMDQVISLMEQYLHHIVFEEDFKLLTPSMINNYVKLDIIPAPEKKKYYRTHIAYLIMICSLKQVIPISRIKEFIELKKETQSLEEIYNNYIKLFKKVIHLQANNALIFNNNKTNADLIDTAISTAIIASTNRYITEFILHDQLPNNSIDKKIKEEKKKNKKEI